MIYLNYKIEFNNTYLIIKLIMDYFSYFIPEKALFGCYPNQELIKQLENLHVKYIINLTSSNEDKITPYRSDTIIFINYPIKDRYIPEDIQSFSAFIVKISNLINNLSSNEKIYIHCKGGHGRSGVVVACLLAYINKISPEKALELTNKYHNNRLKMKDKWRKIGSPQTGKQKKFVYNLFKPFYYNKAVKKGSTVGFSNFSQHPIDVPEIGIFPTAESVFQAYKNINNKEYVEKMKKVENPYLAKIIGNKCEVNENWYNLRYKIMKNIIQLKFEQHKDFKINLLNTGLKHIYNQNYDIYWGKIINNDGENKLGEILMEVRNNYFLKLSINSK